MILNGRIAGTAAFAASLGAAAPAWAQVCAAEKPNWDGLPVPLSVDLVEFLITPLGFGVIIVVCVALMFGRAGPLALAAAVSALAAAYHLASKAAVDFAMGAEGCAPNPMATGVALLILALALAARAFWRRRAAQRRA